MKKGIQLSVIVGVICTLLSFVNSTDALIIGTYGVSENDPAKIELILSEDKTFTYKDFSNSSKIIDVSGNWEVKNNIVLLKDYNSKYSFHTKWKIEKDGMVAKSRKGLTFYTLVKRCDIQKK